RDIGAARAGPHSGEIPVGCASVRTSFYSSNEGITGEYDGTRRRLRSERRMGTPPNDFTLLRLAIQNLSCAPQAQRRYVQLGMMSRAAGNLRRIADHLGGVIA